MVHHGSKEQIRRLAKLGITAHQPGAAAYCKTSEEERLKITESLLIQKVGSNPKAMKLYCIEFPYAVRI